VEERDEFGGKVKWQMTFCEGSWKNLWRN